MSKEKEMMKYGGMRIHKTMMSSYQIEKLEERVKEVSLNKWWMSRYSEERLYSRGFDFSTEKVASMFSDCEIIEYKIDVHKSKGTFQERLVLRTREEFGNLNLVFVVSLTNNCIVTVWFNHKDDNHETINMSLYNPKMKVFV